MQHLSISRSCSARTAPPAPLTIVEISDILSLRTKKFHGTLDSAMRTFKEKTVQKIIRRRDEIELASAGLIFTVLFGYAGVLFFGGSLITFLFVAGTFAGYALRLERGGRLGGIGLVTGMGSSIGMVYSLTSLHGNGMWRGILFGTAAMFVLYFLGTLFIFLYAFLLSATFPFYNHQSYREEPIEFPSYTFTSPPTLSPVPHRIHPENALIIIQGGPDSGRVKCTQCDNIMPPSRLSSYPCK